MLSVCCTSVGVCIIALITSRPLTVYVHVQCVLLPSGRRWAFFCRLQYFICRYCRSVCVARNQCSESCTGAVVNQPSLCIIWRCTVFGWKRCPDFSDPVGQTIHSQLKNTYPKEQSSEDSVGASLHEDSDLQQTYICNRVYKILCTWGPLCSVTWLFKIKIGTLCVCAATRVFPSKTST